MKKILLFCCCLLSIVAFSQRTWNQKLPIQNVGANGPFFDASYNENGYLLLCGSNEVIELDAQAVIHGEIKFPASGHFSNFVRRRDNDPSGRITFLAGVRKLGVPYTFSLLFFKPESGFSTQLFLPDSVGNGAITIPTILEVNDSTLFVFGRKAAYKVRVHANNSFSILWQTTLSIPGGVCKAAVQVNDDFVLFSAAGDIIGVNSAGLQVFTKSELFSFYSAVTLPDGIVTCGENPAHKAVVVKMTYTGDVIWSKEFADQKYNSISTTPDGGLVVTGLSAAGNIVLLKTDAGGLQTWSKEYQTGIGLKVITTPDNGFFMVGSADGASLYGIKTDESGETGPPENNYFIQNRRIGTEGVQATFEPSSTLFFNGFAYGLVSPPDSSVETVRAFGPWIAGNGSDGQLHLAANDYRNFHHDFHAGMINGFIGDFRRVWLARKAEITALRRDFLEDQVFDAEIPYDLLTWPAKGNRNNRYNVDFTLIQSDPNLQAAPFVDVNGDGAYNVFDGDYPRIKGDQMAWWIVNDDSTHFQSEGIPLKIDLAISAYVYGCPQNESVKSSLFVDFDFINRSSLSYNDTYLGFLTDFDLGCEADDYLGSIPASSSYYVYNQDTSDDDYCVVGGGTGFGEVIPVQSVTFQNRELNHFLYYNNSSVGVPLPAQTDPGTPLEYYNYLSGHWKDGTPITAGGSGYNPLSTDYVNYLLPDNPADPQGWSMCTLNPSYTDRRALGTHGPFTFLPGETFSISVAFTTHRNIPLPCPDISGLVKPTIDVLTDWSNNGALELSPNLEVVQNLASGQTLTLGTDLPGAIFQWSTGATSPTITISQAGEYTVTVTGETGCQNVETVLVKWSSGTHTPGAELNWTAYPNPAKDFVQVSCPEAIGGECLLLLRNAQGDIMRRENFNTAELSLNLTGLPAGFYWLELWQGGAFLGSRKCAHVN